LPLVCLYPQVVSRYRLRSAVSSIYSAVLLYPARCSPPACLSLVARCSVRGASLEISWLVGVKLLVHPLITWWLAFHVFELNPLLATVAVIQASLPCGLPVFVLAQQYGTFTTRSSAVIAISTALSLVTVSALFVLLT
jgi:malonate transporter